MDEERLKQIDTELARITEEERILYEETVPQFERGLLEASAERLDLLCKDIKQLFLKYNIPPQLKMQVQSSMDDGRLVCPGIMLRIECLISPIDKLGRGYTENIDVEEKLKNLIQRKENLNKEAENIKTIKL